MPRIRRKGLKRRGEFQPLREMTEKELDAELAEVILASGSEYGDEFWRLFRRELDIVGELRNRSIGENNGPNVEPPKVVTITEASC